MKKMIKMKIQHFADYVKSTNNKTVICKDLTVIPNRVYLNLETHIIKYNDIIKYPIFFDKLLIRVTELYQSYNNPVNIMTFYIEDRKELRKILKGKGGIYVLWCKNNGLFYVGSTVNYLNRFSVYFSKKIVEKTISGQKTSINQELAKYINIYGTNNFQLIILDSILSKDISKFDLYRIEEF